MIRWLDSVGAAGDFTNGADINTFLDTEWAVYDDDNRLDLDDARKASAWLKDYGFVDGHTVAEFEGPYMPFLTDKGERCAELFDGDPEQYLEAQKPATAQQQPVTNTWNFFGPNNQIATGDSSRQEMNIDIGATVDQIAAAINGFAGLARRELNLSPDEDAELTRLESAATASVRSKRPALEPLDSVVQWVMPRIEQGTSEATIATARLLATGLFQQLMQLMQVITGG